MTRFAFGIFVGIGIAFWLIARRIPKTRQTLIDQEWHVPVDPYADGLPW